MLLEKKPDDIKRMFDGISNCYDFANNILSFGLHKIIKKIAINELKIKNKDKILDLCCGSGDLALIVSEKFDDLNIVGADFSLKMIEIAKKKNPKISYVLADATNLPFDNNEFDVVIMGFGLRNIKEYKIALAEANRVLKQKGLFLHLDFESSSKLHKCYDFVVINILKLFIKDIEPYKYLLDSKKVFFSNSQLVELFKEHGFNIYKTKKMLFNMISYQIVCKN